MYVMFVEVEKEKMKRFMKFTVGLDGDVFLTVRNEATHQNEVNTGKKQNYRNSPKHESTESHNKTHLA